MQCFSFKKGGLQAWRGSRASGGGSLSGWFPGRLDFLWGSFPATARDSALPDAPLPTHPLTHFPEATHTSPTPAGRHQAPTATDDLPCALETRSAISCAFIFAAGLSVSWSTNREEACPSPPGGAMRSGARTAAGCESTRSRGSAASGVALLLSFGDRPVKLPRCEAAGRPCRSFNPLQDHQPGGSVGRISAQQ